MKEVKRDLQRIKRRILAKHLQFARLVLGIFLVLLLIGVFAGVRSVVGRTSLGEYASMANGFLFKPKNKAQSFEGRVNILLLGLSGDGEKNPVLADTIILASIGIDEKNIHLISIPRDIWVPELSDKINGAYDQGNKKQAGGGLVLQKASVEAVVGVPIQYAMAIDFDGFAEIIDILGGVTIDVEKSFTDEKFPISGKEDAICSEGSGHEEDYSCRYETLVFEKGVQTMDGGRALKFARSRHSTDKDEGNDLARAKRQQKVLIAIKEKALSREVLGSPRNLSRLWNKAWAITETGLSREELAYVARLAYDARNSISSHVIPEDLLYAPPYSDEYNNLFVFIPKSGDWGQVHDWVKGVLFGGV